MGMSNEKCQMQIRITEHVAWIVTLVHVINKAKDYSNWPNMLKKSIKQLLLLSVSLRRLRQHCLYPTEATGIHKINTLRRASCLLREFLPHRTRNSQMLLRVIRTSAIRGTTVP